MSYTNKEKQAVEHPPSDVSELTSAAVEANTRKADSKALHEPLGSGYTVDNEGKLNNYAIEPEISQAAYPSPQQQRRYIFLGAAAILLVALILGIAFGVS